MSPPKEWPGELVREVKRTLTAMPVALADSYRSRKDGDFPASLLDSREGIYVASLMIAAVVPLVRRVYVDLVAEVSFTLL